MATKKAHVQNGILQASESCDAPVQVGSAQWFQWLETAAQFAFQGQHGKFHARKEKASNGRGTTYWRAYRRLNGQLKRVYLGKNEAVTLAQCEQAAQVLSTPARASIQTSDRRLSQPVLTSRSRPPHINYKKIRRPHIEHLLNDSLRVKLTLVLAPAGYGKTDALTQWTETSSYSVVWVSLEQYDNSAAQFWTKILLATSERITSRGVNEPALHTREVGLLLTQLMSLLTNLTQEIVLVLDNYHHITKPETQQQFDYWISQLPINVHVIVSTRTEPAIALSQLRVANQLRVIGHTTLRWSEEETSHFITNIMQLNLSSEQCSHWFALTKGWAAGLQLLVLSYQTNAECTQTLHKEFVFDYFAEEVFQKQPSDMQLFLAQTAILREFNADLASAVTDLWDCPGRLQHLLHTQMFIAPLDLDRYWYGYHPLFQEFLEHKGKVLPINVDMLYERAAHWYAKKTSYTKAINYFLLAHQYDHAVHIIEHHWLDDDLDWKNSHLHNWLTSIPGSIYERYPMLRIIHVYVLLERSDFLDAEHCLDKIQIVKTAFPSNTQPNQSLLHALYSLAHAIVLLNLGKAQQAYELSLEIVQSQPKLPARFLALAALNLGDSCAVLSSHYDTEAIRALKDAIALGQQAHIPHVVTVAFGSLGNLHLARGDLYEAKSVYQSALAHLRNVSETVVSSGKIHVFLGSLYLEWYDLDTAFHHLQEAVYLCQEWGHLEHLLDSYYYLTLTSIALQNYDAAQNTIDQADTLLLTTFLHKLISAKFMKYKWLFEALQQQINLIRGKIALTTQWTNSPKTLDVPVPVHQVYVRFLLETNRPSSALEHLHLLYQPSKTHIIHHVKYLILQSIVHMEMRGIQAGRRDFIAALKLAEPLGLIHVFWEEGERVVPLLHHCARYAPTYVRKLLLAQPSQMTTYKRGPADLSKREQEVLTLLDAGLTNDAIAEELTIAISTVKKHINNIFQKLHVHSRAAASAQARALNIL